MLMILSNTTNSPEFTYSIHPEENNVSADLYHPDLHPRGWAWTDVATGVPPNKEYAVYYTYFHCCITWFKVDLETPES